MRYFMFQALTPVLQFKLKGILVFEKIIKKNVTFVFGAEFFMYALNIFFPTDFLNDGYTIRR